MRLLVPFLSVAALCSALVIPDQEVLAEDFCIADVSSNPGTQARDEINGGDVRVESWWKILATRKRHDPVSSLALSVLEFLARFDQLTHLRQNLNYGREDGDDIQEDSASVPYPLGSCPPHICPATNHTLWQIISQSRRTERIAEVLSHERKLVALLNSSHANYTFFAPTNRALEDFLEDNPAPSSWSDILAYHIVHGAFPIKILKHQQTLTTELNQTGPGHQAQRLIVTVDEDEVYLNDVSRVIQEDNEIIASNGVLQQINHVLVPPPATKTLLSRLPSRFSTFALALSMTALEDYFHPGNRLGGTTFALTNSAFDRLGEKANAYLFSPQGEQCLRVLMKYHIVVNTTLYSDALYDAHGRVQKFGPDGEPVSVHVELSTLLQGQRINLDISKRRGGMVLRINGFHRLEEMDLLVSDGVVHVLDRVLVPPKKLRGDGKSGSHVEYLGGELTVEELQQWLGGCGPKPRMEL